MIPIIFFGTHEFAAIILKALLDSGLFDIQKVITMPDRPAGRSHKLKLSAVKTAAGRHGLTIGQPENLENYTSSGSQQLNIVVDYGLIIPLNIIETPKFGSVNIHPSLLPKYRGASPIQSALINGKKETGVTIMKMDKEMDHGPILAQEKISIKPEDNYVSLYKKLAERAAEMIVKIIPLYIEDKIKLKEQNHGTATFTKILSREDGKINFKTRTADEIYNLWRGLTPWPGIFCEWNGKRLKLIKIAKNDKKSPAGKASVENKKISIGCRQGSIIAEELQMEGKKSMTAETFLNGYQKIDGYVF